MRGTVLTACATIFLSVTATQVKAGTPSQSSASQSSTRNLNPPARIASSTRMHSERALEQDAVEETRVVPVFLHNVNTLEDRMFLLTLDGEIVGEDENAVKEFFRCKRTKRKHRMHAEVLAKLAEVADHYPGKTIEIVSGYRRTGFGVKNSKHFRGRAIDMRVRGIKTAELRDFLWQGGGEGMGLGHYRSENFVHIDHRPGEPKTAWTQRRKNASYQYNPKWSREDNEPNS